MDTQKKLNKKLLLSTALCLGISGVRAAQEYYTTEPMVAEDKEEIAAKDMEEIQESSDVVDAENRKPFSKCRCKEKCAHKYEERKEECERIYERGEKECEHHYEKCEDKVFNQCSKECKDEEGKYNKTSCINQCAKELIKECKEDREACESENDDKRSECKERNNENRQNCVEYCNSKE